MQGGGHRFEPVILHEVRMDYEEIGTHFRRYHPTPTPSISPAIDPGAKVFDLEPRGGRGSLKRFHRCFSDKPLGHTAVGNRSLVAH